MPHDNTAAADTLLLTSEIVSSFVRNNSVSPARLPELIGDVRRALDACSSEDQGNQADVMTDTVPPRPIKPAVHPKRSIKPDYIICLEDGRRMKVLTQHLRKFNLSPEEYRRRWGLPDDYPMTAPNYSAKRASIARDNGLGTARTR